MDLIRTVIKNVFIIAILQNFATALTPQIVHPWIFGYEQFSEIGVKPRSQQNITCILPRTNQSSLFKWRKELFEVGGSRRWVNMDNACEKYNPYTDPSKQISSKCSVVHDVTEKSSNLTLMFESLHPIDFANYSCGSEEDYLFVHLRMVTVTYKYEYSTNSTTTYEGNRTSLECQLTRGYDSRYEAIWRIGNEYLSPRQIRENPDRFMYDETYDLSNLTFMSPQFSDRGRHQCALWDKLLGNGEFNETFIVAYFEFLLRVRDNYESVTPLLVIIGQVLLLGIGLALYEWHQQRKNIDGETGIGANEESDAEEDDPGIYREVSSESLHNNSEQT